MARIVGESAHLTRRHIEEVPGVGGAVGNAPSDVAATLYQLDREGAVGSFEEMGRDEGSAEACTENGNGGGGVEGEHGRGIGREESTEENTKS